MGFPGEVEYVVHSAELRVSGDRVDFDLVRESLGLLPTTLTRAGETVSAAIGPATCDEWVHRAPVAGTEPLAHHLDAIVRGLEAHEEGLRALCHRYEVRLIGRWHSDLAQGHLELPSRLLLRLGQLGLKLEVSLLSWGGVLDAPPSGSQEETPPR